MRVVSLVPSLTETLVTLVPDRVELVGRTAFCTKPSERLGEVAVVGGTKTPNLRKLLDLRPDLVLLDRDENREDDAARIAEAGIARFVVQVDSCDQVPDMLRRLGAAVGEREPFEHRASLVEGQIAVHTVPPPGERVLCLPLIWVDPLMTIARETYGGSLLEKLGWELAASPAAARYPELGSSWSEWKRIEAVLLPSEPYPFGPEDVERIEGTVRERGGSAEALLVDGEDLFWYGSRTGAALSRLAARLGQERAEIRRRSGP